MWSKKNYFSGSKKKKMTKLKTIKDFEEVTTEGDIYKYWDYTDELNCRTKQVRIIRLDILREEAVKWIKDDEKLLYTPEGSDLSDGQCLKIIMESWKERFNIK